MLKRGRLVLGFGVIVLCGFACTLLVPAQVFAARVNMSPPTVSLTEGQSQTITLSLDNPIVCQTLDVTCTVVITPLSADPARLTVPNTPITILYTQWAQPVTFSVTAVDDQLYSGNLANAITFTTQSNSEYYDGFVPSLNLTVLENDAAPVVVQPSTPVQASKAELAKSGQFTLMGILGGAQIIFWAVFVSSVLRTKSTVRRIS